MAVTQCPMCKKNNCKTIYRQEVLVPGSSKTVYKANINPLKPFTLATAKTKTTKDVTYQKQIYKCMDCEYEFDYHDINRQQRIEKSNKNTAILVQYIINHKFACNIISAILFILSFVFMSKGISFLAIASLLVSTFLCMITGNILICALSILIMVGYSAFLLGK